MNKLLYGFKNIMKSSRVRLVNDNKLVLDTYNLALKNNPKATPLLHSDRGFQYTSKEYINKLKKDGLTQSMSRVGCCIDNGPTYRLL